MSFPKFDERLAFINEFVLELAEAHRSGTLTSWDELDQRVKTFFTPERMEQTEALVPGWQKMASYAGGVTLTHVMCVFLGLVLLPEFETLTPDQQQLAKWIVLFHDVEKQHVRGVRDYVHGFKSAVTAAHTLVRLGFPAQAAFDTHFATWSALTASAIAANQLGESIQDNRKLPEILAGIEQLYGVNTPATLIVKGVLLHMSITVVHEWPQAAPLAEPEIKRYVDPHLYPLLEVMMLADNEGWVMFEPEVRREQRNETLDVYRAIAALITR